MNVTADHSTRRDDVQSLEAPDEAAVSEEAVAGFSDAFGGDRANRLARNAVVNAEATTVGLNREAVVDNLLRFSHEIDSGAITHQKRSGRCWAFAALNRMRLDVIEETGLEDFEFSQAYVMFWDKLEKANYFLENVLWSVDEPTDSRLFFWLVDNPVADAGQWDMLVNLVRKYGLVPKEAYPESTSSSATVHMNRHLTEKLREWAAELRSRHRDGASISELRERKSRMLETTYRMLAIHNGEPPTSFEWSWRDDDEEFHDLGEVRPREFVERFVEMDLEEYVSLIHCPTDGKSFGETYTIDYLGNVVEGRSVEYLNVELDVLKAAVQSCIEQGEAVWFGCDVGERMHRDRGILDVDAFEFDALYDTQFRMDKGQRVMFGHSKMTHAMLLTGVHLDGGSPVRWKVENSWGEETGQKGFMVMGDEWFDEYVFQVVVPQAVVEDETLAPLEEAPVVLPPWDPMGALATGR